MRLVFDLDGTLVDTREANRRAYLTIGVTPPDDFHQIPWQSWVAPERHAAKQEIFAQFLPVHGKLLPAYTEVMSRTGGVILTNASERSVAVVLQTFPELVRYDLVHGVPPRAKPGWLAEHGETGIYFDDSSFTLELVRNHTRWQTVNVSGL